MPTGQHKRDARATFPRFRQASETANPPRIMPPSFLGAARPLRQHSFVRESQITAAVNWDNVDRNRGDYPPNIRGRRK